MLFAMGLGFVVGYIVGSTLKEREKDEEMDETIKATTDRLNKVYEKKEEQLKEERKEFEAEKEHFTEVKHQLYSDLTRDEQLEQLCDPELGIPVEEDNILRYNMLKRQYLRIGFIEQEDFESGVFENYTFETHYLRMFNDGAIYDVDDGERIDDDDSHIGNLASGMGTGKTNDIRYIRNWDELCDYEITYVNEDSTGFVQDMFGDCSDEDPIEPVDESEPEEVDE
jgi:hypothetical protein